MELVKTNEMVNRSYVDGEPKEEVTAVTYAVVENGLAVGQADIQNGHFYLNADITGTIEEIRAKVESMFATVTTGKC